MSTLMLFWLPYGWCLHAAFLIVPTWGLYQGVRLAVALAFCWAAQEAPTGLRLVRQRRAG